MEDMNTMIANSSLPTRLSAWIQYLRTPGVSLQYTMEKRHIPDMTALDCASSGGSANSQKANGDKASATSKSGKNAAADTTPGDATAGLGEAGSPAGAGCTCASGTAGSDTTDTTDVMQLTGTLRARYFDLAAGMLGIVAACCLIKGCLCGCRCLRKHMC